MAASLMSCRIQTLVDCYGAQPNLLDCYRTEQGGTICRFGDRLLSAGKMDIYEFLEFSGFVGTRFLEWEMATADLQNMTLPGWELSSNPILHYVGDAKALSEGIDQTHNLRRCFNILCESDAQFAQSAEYLPWLSDMTSRQNRGRAEAYLLKDSALACVTAKASDCAYLSSVAVVKAERGQGLGRVLVAAVAAALALDGRAVFTAAQNDSLTDFYIKCGFIPLLRRLIVAKRR